MNIDIEKQERIDSNRIEAYTSSFLTDHKRTTIVTDKVLEESFKNCVIPAAKRLYPRIKQKVEEMKLDPKHSKFLRE